MAKLLSQYADEDALFTADTGTCWVWALRHIKVNGLRKFLMSLRHGTMANSMPMALGLKKAYPNRQVIALCGDGGLAMLMGDLLTINQEDLPIKIVVVNNGALDFVELEMKAEGLLNNYTDLHNPSFAKIAQAVGIKAFEVKNALELDGVMQEFLAHKGPALIDVYTNRSELVMPPSIDLGNVVGMATYSAKAILNGRIADVETLMANTLQSAKHEI
nr:thiamine pyrophosphate-dependent enzyme [Polynucleobacter sp. JS-Safj-400b-B2]